MGNYIFAYTEETFNKAVEALGLQDEEVTHIPSMREIHLVKRGHNIYYVVSDLELFPLNMRTWIERVFKAEGVEI